MTERAADYEAAVTRGAAGSVTPPSAVPMPTPRAITVEVAAQTPGNTVTKIGVTVDPDPNFSASDNVDRVHGLVIRKLRDYGAENH